MLQLLRIRGLYLAVTCVEYECCAEKCRKIWIVLEMNAEVRTAHASIAEFDSRCSVVLRDLDIMSTSIGKIRFIGRKLHKMLPSTDIFWKNPHISNVKVTSRRMEQCAQSMLPAQI